jgi:CBS domain-containing protein
MVQTVKDVMTSDVVSCDVFASIRDVAQLMRDHGIGDVLVRDGEKLYGIVTDRDLVVRCLAEGADASRATVREACSQAVTSVAPGLPVDEAAQLMRDKAIRRLPVVHHGKPVGIVTLGDLAVEREPTSALAEISMAPPNS